MSAATEEFDNLQVIQELNPAARFGCCSWIPGKPEGNLVPPPNRIFGNYTRGPVEPTVFEIQPYGK
jgi:hypothetical protein